MKLLAFSRKKEPGDDNVRNPKMMKPYHSSAFPITAAATWIGFGVA
jgi:hypothetical protein